MGIRGSYDMMKSKHDRDFYKHQKAKAILCKLPMINMQHNCFSAKLPMFINDQGPAVSQRLLSQRSQEKLEKYNSIS